MIRTSRQLKDLVRNLSKEIGIEPHILIRKYMMECFLERLSLSDYNNRFILKGGLLVSAYVGVEARATMDIDTTIKEIPLNLSEMQSIISEITKIDVFDNVKLEVKKVDEIMEDAEYTGLRFSMEGRLDGAKIPFKLDISTGDAITPKEIVFSYKLMFENRRIDLVSYPIETVLAEKLETIISRTTANTRMRDFYDIHILLQSQEVDADVMVNAFEKTAKQRGSVKRIESINDVLESIRSSEYIKKLWRSYQKKYYYAKDCEFEDVMESIYKLSLMSGLKVNNK